MDPHHAQHAARGEQADHFGQAFHAARIVDPDASQSERAYALWTHLGPGMAWVVALFSSGLGFPVPLLIAWIMWLSRKSESPFLDDHGKQSLNFQISLIALFIILALLSIPTCFFSVAAIPLVLILAIVGAVMGGIAASKGEFYRYPMTWQWVK